jgi:hypothetical protein
MTATTRRPAAVLAVLLISLAVLPAAAIAQPAGDGAGPRGPVYSTPSGLQPAPTVVRTTAVEDDPIDVLPIILASAALIVALGASGYMLIPSPLAVISSAAATDARRLSGAAAGARARGPLSGVVCSARPRAINSEQPRRKGVR